MIYVTSDLHFNHKNIINLCYRPFKSVEDMNEILIENWNKAVRYDDEVYILGDIALSNNAEEIQKYLRTIPGITASDEDIRNGGAGVTVVKL